MSKERLPSYFSTSLIALVLISAALPAMAEEDKMDPALPAKSITDLITKGKAYINFRYRYEHVDQENLPRNAKASTLRSRVGFKSGEFMGLSGMVEVEDVQEIGDDKFNNTINGRADYPVVADVEGTEINQANLSYSGIPKTSLKAGRHTLVLDNARFIGDVGWRQNNQTQDGATITNASLDDTLLFYGYAWGINRIFGEDSPMGEFDTNIHMFNIKHSGLEFADLVAYAYLLDIDESPVDSTSTFGGRANGKFGVSDTVNVVYDLEYAYQEDYEDNPTTYDASFFRTEAGLNFYGLTVKGGFESLGSDGGKEAFSTPLATLHKFNGWADIFLNTPETGLEDAYASLIYQVSGVHQIIDGTKLVATYHDFSAEKGSADYGTEWDFLLTRDINEHFGVGIKYANYDSDGFANDTEKLIFQLTSAFSQ